MSNADAVARFKKDLRRYGCTDSPVGVTGPMAHRQLLFNEHFQPYMQLSHPTMNQQWVSMPKLGESARDSRGALLVALRYLGGDVETMLSDIAAEVVKAVLLVLPGAMHGNFVGADTLSLNGRTALLQRDWSETFDGQPALVLDVGERSIFGAYGTSLEGCITGYLSGKGLPCN